MNSSALAQKGSESDIISNQCYDKLIGLTTDDMESMEQIVRLVSRNSTKYVREIMTLPVKKVEGLIHLLDILIKCLNKQEKFKQYFQTKFTLENFKKLLQSRLKQKVGNVQLLQKQKLFNRIYLKRQEQIQSSQSAQLLSEDALTQQKISSIIADLSQEEAQYIIDSYFEKNKIQSYLPWLSLGICLWLMIISVYDLQKIGIFYKLIVLSILQSLTLVLRILFYYTIENCGIIKNFYLTIYIKRKHKQILINQSIKAAIRNNHSKDD